jgi:hypothetical protein
MALSSLGRLAAQVQTEADKQPRAEECAQDEEYDSQSAMVYSSHWLTMPPLIDFHLCNNLPSLQLRANLNYPH